MTESARLKPKFLPIGYLYKRIAFRPDWLKVKSIREIYSLSGCISEDFADYIDFWKHNGYWLFDSPSILHQLASKHSIDLDQMKLFYYEAYEFEYEAELGTWIRFESEKSFATSVIQPKLKLLEGFDVVSFHMHTSPECSPLSCNSLAESLHTNEHCLLSTFEETILALQTGKFQNCEPGPYRVIAVYSPLDE